ncbi:hypothetical protein AJ80_04201 [Polytolypa hystricis UAMH7299]|uniref:Uncharacterized protein n=1 Tax=Polytolypa hystricis (strain UAMH7299) TaxID=1447883 RepID=A0A2B7YDK6_POLH7|nr:hypothetical protein AJ80_04201 [Polytolypa hystricis UAMH7299]
MVARQYDAVIYKRGPGPENGHDEPFNWFIRNIERHEVKIQETEKRIGNDEGFAMLDHLQKLQNEMSEMKDWMKKESAAREKESAAMKKENAEMKEELSISMKASISLRRGVLEERRVANREGEQKDRQIAIIRNEIAHGGDIVGDIRAIQYCEEQRMRRVSEYKEDFSQTYGIAFNDAATKAPLYPSKVIRAFDILASVRELHAWKGDKVRISRKAIEEIATEIIDAAKCTEQDKLLARLGEGGDLLEKCDEMVRLFGNEN